ncbi:MAG: c-type cytochrome [Bdellovibrionales bacterium]|nr:c-type cytochrome [Bdellovibrionales bacterium]
MKYLLPLTALIFSLNSFGKDIAKGKSLYAACIQCHGENGEGNVEQQGPRLSGQYDWYIVSQLEAFQNGTRKNEKMMPYIKNLSKKDFDDLAAYVSSL